MKKPDQETTSAWVEGVLKDLKRRSHLMKNGWHRQEDLSIQSAHSGTAMTYADLGRAKFLNGDPIAQVRAAFTKAAQHVIKSFTMAYDPTDPDYVGDKPSPYELRSGYGFVNWSAVSETGAIDGFNYALLGADFDTAIVLAQWYQDSKDGHKMDLDVNRYTYAYKYTLLGETSRAKPLVQLNVEDFMKKRPKHIGDKNYFMLSQVLLAILNKDESVYNDALGQLLAFYKKSVIPAEDHWDTPEEFICDNAVALANLGIHYGLNVTVEHALLPKGLLTN